MAGHVLWQPQVAQRDMQDMAAPTAHLAILKLPGLCNMQ